MRRATLLLLCAALHLTAGGPRDTTLFVVQLNEDSASLFYCNRDRSIRELLSGPVLMGNGGLLLYSQRGYVLYDSAGAVADSLNVGVQQVAKVKEAGGDFTLACPLDSTSVLFYRPLAQTNPQFALYRKAMLKRRAKETKEEEYGSLSRLTGGILMNIARNAATDEMAQRVYLAPQLVGFVAPDRKSERWWSIDRFYSSSSPMINEADSTLVSFFPGINLGKREMRNMAIDMVGTWKKGGRRYYLGVSAPLGSQDWQTTQTLYLCDHAGNVMFTDEIPKQVNTEVVLGKDNDPRRNVVYTARATKRFVFPPVVDGQGRVHYGLIDYEARKLAVHRRTYPEFVPTPTEPILAHLIDIEKDITFEPLSLSCNRGQNTGARIPRVRFTDPDGNRREARPRDLARGEYLARITRITYRDVESKLSRGRSGLPPAPDRMRDSIASMSTAGCPYSLSLSGPKGVIRTFDYGAGEQVLCARVITVRASGTVLVRVDLSTYAELLAFRPSGKLVGRFIFNRQNVTQRQDVVVALKDSPILELDYEQDSSNGRYLAWTLSTP